MIPPTGKPTPVPCAWAGPRIPLPGWPKGDAEGAAAALARSAFRGRQLAALLDPDVAVPGVTQAPFRPEMAVIAVPATTDGRNMTGDDFAVTAGWGHLGKGDAVMPGQGRVVERPFTPEERSSMAAWHDMFNPVGDTTLDVYLNDRASWRNVPPPRLALQAGRLSSAQEVALLQGAGRAGAGATGCGGIALCSGGA